MNSNDVNLGAFSISLAVKDLQASKTFYQKLGFSVVGGEAEQNWLILRNGEHTIGLFQGMFENNILTFNPGWNQQCENLKDFMDVRDIHAKLKKQGLDISNATTETAKGPTSLSLLDPDGTAILIDQHV